ncbi:SURF1 family protein [Mycobacterium sp. KBS0706]|uniref:SURF1 family protein n=1 Tax=Mycobacterium sp. KBS0706 TaxID=2578109 RepID=UPI00110F9130|nr:SURF1 family protein [Mycobacterium sp. KBS0706]TSD88174.1 SURF1 family protein [Mycobacterium sp. KBS0706]
MTARRFRPEFWPTVFLVPALALMLGLGIWQLERLAWKTDLIDRIEHGLAAPPAPLPTETDPSFDYRHVTITGRFDAAHAFRLLARVHDGAAGIQVVTPLLRADGGPAVLVNRGWVPLGPDGKPTAFDPPPDGTVTVEGVARRPLPQGWMQPDNSPATNEWFWTDLPAMAAAAGLERAAPVVVEQAAGPDRPRPPIGGQTNIDLPNNHLEYAITWFSFAFMLVAIYLLHHLRRGRAARKGPDA